MPLMNALTRLALLSTPVFALAAQAAPEASLPDRPAAAVSKYKDNWAPVVAAHSSLPVVMVDKSQVVLEANAPILLTIGEHYSPGFVTIKDINLTDIAPTNDLEQAATDSNMKATAETFDATVESDTDLSNAYAVLIASPQKEAPDAPPSLAVRVSEIGDMTAGKSNHLSVRLPKVRFGGERDWSLLIFSGGLEVRSTNMGELLTGYFDRMETISLKKKIAERIAQGKDVPISVFRRMPLNIPDDIKAKYHGQKIKVQMTVGPDGHVVSATAEGIDDPELTEALTKAFAPLLFLPQVKGGVAVSATAPVPITL
jgi:hypothetical protein